MIGFGRRDSWQGIDPQWPPAPLSDEGSITLVAGVDSSTQSVKVTVHDASTGAVVRQGSAPHPAGTCCPAQRWWDAQLDASAELLDDVAASLLA